MSGLDPAAPAADPEGRPAPGARLRISRRRLFGYSAGVGAAIAVPGALAGCFGGDDDTTTTVASFEEAQFFDDNQARTLDAVLERLIPEDDEGPGARSAQAWRYIDRALAEEVPQMVPTAPMYEEGLATLDELAQSEHDAAFAELDEEEKDDLLIAMEAGELDGFTPDSATFFATVKEHCWQGMFGDPMYGGNAEFIGWDMMAFPGVKLVFPASEQEIGADVEIAHQSVADIDMFEMSGHQHGGGGGNGGGGSNNGGGEG